MSERIDLGRPWTGRVPIGTVMPNPDQPRKHFDAEALERTGRSAARGQIQPIAVVAHRDAARPAVRWMIVDGERRWRALKAQGAQTIKIAYDPELGADGIYEASLAANFCREGHTNQEKIAAVAKLRSMGRSLDEIAELVGHSSSWAGNYAALAGLHPRLQEAMDFPPRGERKLPTKIALLLAGLKPFDQLGQWEKVKDQPQAEAFHKLRTNGRVRHGVKRSAADDADYCEGKAAKALQSVEALLKLPLPMLRSLTVENLTALLKICGKIGTQLMLTNERLNEARADAGRRGK